MIHSLANIEQWAIDLSWDIICRFSSLEYPDKTKLPREFFDDFIKVACDEAKVKIQTVKSHKNFCTIFLTYTCLYIFEIKFKSFLGLHKHFKLLENRLVEMGSYFGALPVHNGLWESATVTKDNFLSRLAIVHMVHEARLKIKNKLSANFNLFKYSFLLAIKKGS